MELSIQYPDLEPLAKGGSFSLVIQHLYYAHLLRYSTPDMLKELSKSVKVATKKKLQYLTDQSYLVNHDGIFTTTNKTLSLLIKFGYNPALLPLPAEGRGAEIYNQEALVKLLVRPDFKALLYPNFGYLIPDGLLILQDGSRYALNFIEIEARKPKWAEYLEDKREKYNRLAEDEQAYQYWQFMSQHLGLKCPPASGFKFGVWCIGSIRRDWHAWVFNS